MTALPLCGQIISVTAEPGITPPRIRHKTDPQYTTYARAYRIQGSVVVRALINPAGRAEDISVISSLGYGLDEKAVESVRRWDFAPATSGGQPVAAPVTLEVKFRHFGMAFNESFERQRTSFNVAMQTVGRHDPATLPGAIETVQHLARKGFPAALYLAGMWQIDGEMVPKDIAAGNAKIQKAAQKNFGPAIYQIALVGLKDATNSEHWDQMRRAAMLGSTQAQFLLGNAHDRGVSVDKDPGRARNYFRMCAARGVAECQYRLGLLLLNTPHRLDYEYEQAMAWIALAADRGVGDANRIFEREKRHFTLPQETAIGTMKRQFTGRFD